MHFKHYPPEIIERVLTHIQQIREQELYNEIWYKSFKDGNAGAYLAGRSADLLADIEGLLERDLLEHKLLENTEGTK